MQGYGRPTRLSTFEIERILADAGGVRGLESREVLRRLEAGAKDVDLDKRLNAHNLIEMEEGRLYDEAVYDSTLDYAMRRLRLSERRARERMRVGRKLRDLPLLDAFFCMGPAFPSARSRGWSSSFCSCGWSCPTPRLRGCSTPWT